MSKFQLIKITLLIVILAEEIKRATKKVDLSKIVVRIEADQISEIVQEQINSLKSTE